MSKPNADSAEAQQAPACFGAPSCYASNSKICEGCVAYKQCGQEVTATLERIKGIVNVEDMLHKHNQALAKARNERKEKKAEETKPDLEKPMRPMPKQVERASKVEKIVYEIDERTETLIMALPVKARTFATQLCKAGLIAQIKANLKTGGNPLEKTGPKWLSVALVKLIDGGFDRAGLRVTFTEQLQWSNETAASHVSLAIKLFTMFDIAIEEDARIVANPTLLNDNDSK